MALPVKNRLSKKKDFDTVFKEGKTIKGSFLFIKIIVNNYDTSRFGFIIPSKIYRKAVIRNRIRRRLSEFVRINIGKTNSNYDVIVVIKSRSINPGTLTEDLGNILKKARIIS